MEHLQDRLSKWQVMTLSRELHHDEAGIGEVCDLMPDMTDLARHFPDFTIFYNGPKCGASAPDHFHFQACPRGLMPLERDIDLNLDGGREDLTWLTSVQDAELFHYHKFTRGVFVLTARTSKSMAKLFYRLLDCLPQREGRKKAWIE